MSDDPPEAEPRALFKPWADSLLWLALAAALAAVVGIPVLLMAWMRSPLHTDVGRALPQPVEFDHRHHVRDDGISCLYCHHDAYRSASAGMPDTATCMGCHQQIWSESPALAVVRNSSFEQRPLRWNRVYDLPDFVYFNHSIHVRKGVGCESCHGRVDLMPSVRKAASLQMGWCLGCHRDPAPRLRPADKITQMGYVPDGAPSSQGAALRQHYQANPSTECTACHR